MSLTHTHTPPRWRNLATLMLCLTTALSVSSPSPATALSGCGIGQPYRADSLIGGLVIGDDLRDVGGYAVQCGGGGAPWYGTPNFVRATGTPGYVRLSLFTARVPKTGNLRIPRGKGKGWYISPERGTPHGNSVWKLFSPNSRSGYRTLGEDGEIVRYRK